MKLAIVGATGLVGQEVLKVLEERNVEFDELYLVASAKSVGQNMKFKGKEYTIKSIEEGCKLAADVAIFSAGGGTSLEWAPRYAEMGTIVIDNSSAWRMDPTKKLIVPEINGHVLTNEDRIIANPNCSTIQMVLALAPLHRKYKLKRIVVSTYQSVTGTGKDAVQQMMEERKGITNGMKVYPHKIDLNALPHIDSFLDNGYTKEEMKVVQETQKILELPNLPVTCTAVRVPVVISHSEAVTVDLERPVSPAQAREALANDPIIEVWDTPEKGIYPTPLEAAGQDPVYVGRIRRDTSSENGLNLWVVADNLRIGAALNAVRIAEYLVEHKLLKQPVAS